jgi:hypothetical protein
LINNVPLALGTMQALGAHATSTRIVIPAKVVTIVNGAVILLLVKQGEPQMEHVKFLLLIRARLIAKPLEMQAVLRARS